MQIRLVLVLISLAVAGSALAQDLTGCEKFAWSMGHERALFNAADKPALPSGTSLGTLPGGAFVLRLTSTEVIAWTLPPERSRKSPGSLGGMIVLPAPPRSGIYQVTLSADVWLDVIQDGRYARAVGSSGRSDCEGLRKSVRLELQQQPFTLQVSGSSADAITIAIRPIE